MIIEHLWVSGIKNITLKSLSKSQQEYPIHNSDVSQCHGGDESQAEVVRFPMMHLWFFSISRLCIGAVHLACRVAAVTVLPARRPCCCSK